MPQLLHGKAHGETPSCRLTVIFLSNWHGLKYSEMQWLFEVANSFLIIASPNQCQLIDMRVLAYHYTTDRIAAYCKESVFTLNDCGDICVRYRRLGKTNEDVGTNSADNPLVRFICPDQDEYVFGMPLSLEFIRIVTKDGWSFDQVADLYGIFCQLLKLSLSQKV